MIGNRLKLDGMTGSISFPATLLRRLELAQLAILSFVAVTVILQRRLFARI